MGVRRCWRNRVARLAAAVTIVVGAVAVGRAGDQPKELPSPLKRTVERVPSSTATFTLLQLPAGKITIKDKDGKSTEVEIKPVWIGQTEVTWDEYDVFWEATDLPEDQRPGVKSDKFVIRSRPSVPYSPPHRGWGHDGSPAG